MNNELLIIILSVLVPCVIMCVIMCILLLFRISSLEARYNSDIQKIVAWQNEQTKINKALVSELSKINTIPIQYEWGKA